MFRPPLRFLELNHYTNLLTPGYKDVLGLAYTTNHVWVNGSTNGVDRHAEYFHKELALDNSGGPVWTSVTITNQNGTNTGGFALGKNQQTPAFDGDGNPTADSIWAYAWDGADRLKTLTMTNVGSVPNSQRKQLMFSYDGEGRRIMKVVRTWNGSAFAGTTTNLFVYDGWRLIAVLTNSMKLVQSFAWGLDLSGTEEGAGGIGGLLVFAEHGAGPNRTNHFYAHDGNGNILALVKASDTTISARYEYGPFGEPIRATGPAAKANPFRWSTKYCDEETGLVYYGYRYYSPTLGRWLNRDPLEEEGGLNLYAFCGNNAINAVDPDGQFFLLDILLADSTMIALRTRQAAIQARIFGSLSKRIYEGLIFIPAVITDLAITGAARSYTATTAILYANPMLAYEGAAFFTQAIGLQPGPTPPTPGNLAGAAVNGAFEAWMDYVSSPETK